MTDPVSATAAVLTSFAHANNLLKAGLAVRDSVVNLEQVNELLAEINSIQAGYFSLLQQNTSMLAEVDNLKKEIASFKTWDTQKQRYQLTPFESGPGIVYALKESMSNSEPPHYICTRCYEEGKRMILQPAKINGFIHIVCPSCKFDIPTHMRGIGAPQYAIG
jgi:regulator of replication initiation timing